MEDQELIVTAINKARSLMGTNDQAVEIILRQVLRLSPGNLEVLQLLGLLKYQMGSHTEALEIFQFLLESVPAESANLNNIGLCLSGLGYHQKAIESTLKACEKDQANYMYLNNLAIQYRHLGDLDSALRCMKKSIKLKLNAASLVNLGGIYGQAKDLKKSISCFRKAIQMSPQLASAHVDLAYSLHLLGSWEEAFKEYEWRFDLFPQLRFYRQAYDQNKRWDGEKSLNGKRILIYGEQGLGDLVQFIRYAKDIKAKGAHVIVHCADPIKSLISRSEGVDETFVRNIVTAQAEDFPDYDFHCSALSLPYLLKCKEYSGKPYIKPLAKLDIKAIYRDTFNVGIVWAGNPAHPHDIIRSVPLKYFWKISEMPKVKLFSLQVDTRSRAYTTNKKPVDLTEGADGMKVVNMKELIQNFEDTANVLAGLDLLISVDTATLHLAGAIGTPAWGLLPFNCDWRWKAEGESTVWYDSVKLFRQDSSRQWEPVFEKIYEELNAHLLQN